MSGRLDRRFIDTGGSLDLRIDQMDLAPDGDGLFRVTEFFCHDDTWKLTLARLVDESDAVLMDLRGFSQLNSGCVFEIHELVNVVPLQRVVFAIDESTGPDFHARDDAASLAANQRPLAESADRGWSSFFGTAKQR